MTDVCASATLGGAPAVGQAGWEEQPEANKQAYYREFAEGPMRRMFETLTPAQVIDMLNQNTGGVLSQAGRDRLSAEMVQAFITSIEYGARFAP